MAAESQIRLLPLLFCATIAIAEPNLPINIEADRLELEQRQEISIWQGNVRLQHGDLHLYAERLELHGKGRQIEMAVATGEPARVENHDPNNKGPDSAEARHLKYIFSSRQIELSGNAKVNHGGDHFSGEHLIYDSRQRTIKAVSSNPATDKGETNGNRIQLILQPAEPR